MSETSKIDNFHYVKKMAKGFEDDEKRFLFIRSQILSFEECMEDGLQKSQLIKSLITWVLKEFAKVEGYKSDPRMLVLWKLLGKYSVNIGMDGVLENVHRLGFFKSCPDFYLMWADYLGSNDNKENFDKVIQVCEKNCQISSAECQELFRPLIEKYFDIDYNEGKTLDLMKIFDDGKEVVKPDLTLFQNKRGALSTSEMELVNVINTTKVISKNKEKTINNEKDVETFKLMDVHLPQGIQNKVPTEEYSIYKDVTYSKTTTATTCDVKNNEKNRRISYYPGLDDITIAGSHGKFSSDMFTSTPRRSVMPNDFEPILEGFTDKGFVDSVIKEKTEEVGLFGINVGKTSSKGVLGVGDLKMKKRLSFADEKEIGGNKNINPMAEAVERLKKSKNNPNELVRTLPYLKISSTIHEESEEKKKTFDSPEFPSPFRKKKKDYQ